MKSWQRYLKSKITLIFSILFILEMFLQIATGAELEEIQRAIEEKDANWVAGETSMSKLPLEERRLRLGLLLKPNGDEEIKESPSTVGLPSHFDWRDNDGDWVTEIKDQGACGSCWAFATVGAMESLIRIAQGNANLGINLSEQFQVSCDKSCYPPPYEEYCQSGCDGGYLDLAADFVKNTGAPDEACFPYAAADVPCSNRCPDWSSRVKKIDNWSWVCEYVPDVATIKNAVYENPIQCGMEIYEDFYYYTGGIYQHVSGIFLGYHAVIIIGWDDGSQSWMCKNSWGTNWGEDGFFRIKWNDCEIGAESIDMDMAPLGHVVTITSGPTASPNPVASGGTVNLSVEAEDSEGHNLTYSWTVNPQEGSFDNPNLQNPNWMAPVNSTCANKIYTITVTVACSVEPNIKDEESVEVIVTPENPPVIVVNPTSLSESLDCGEKSSQTLTIQNEGECELTFEITTEPVISTVLDRDVGRADRETLMRIVDALNNRAVVPPAGIKKYSGGSSSSPFTKASLVRFNPQAGSTLNVAVLGADDFDWNNDVVEKLLSTGQFASVTAIAVQSVTPTLSELQAYDAVLVYSDYEFQDAVTLGNNLADYVDAGGSVVVAVFAMTSEWGDGWIIDGRFHTDNYFVIEGGSLEIRGHQTLGTVHEPSHPIMANVSSFDGGELSFRPRTGVVSGAARVADWSDGKPLVATRIIKGVRRVDLGFFSPSSDVGGSDLWQTSTDGEWLMANSLVWVAGGGTSWLSANPTTGSVAPGSSLVITVTFDATNLGGGEYSANLVISNNSATPKLPVPASLSVIAGPHIVVEPLKLDFGKVLVDTTAKQTLTVKNTGCEELVAIITSSNPVFTPKPPGLSVLPGSEETVTVSFKPTELEIYNATLKIMTNDQSNPQVDIPMTGEGATPPKISVSPESFSESLNSGETSSQILTIKNDGGCDLAFEIEIAPADLSVLGEGVVYASKETLLAIVDALNNRAVAPPVGATKKANSGSSPSPFTKASFVRFNPQAGLTLNVAVLGADDFDWNNDVVEKLLSTGQFASVTAIAVQSVTPTLSELQAYDAVLVYSDYKFEDAVALGNNLADYVDAGGGVVVAVFAMTSEWGDGWILDGRFHTDNYFVIEGGSLEIRGHQTLGTVHEPSHPIMTNVSSFDGGDASFRPQTDVVSGATRIADWSDGKPLVATRIVSGTLRADLGLFPPSSDICSGCWLSSTDGEWLMANSLVWVAGGGTSWLRVTPWMKGVVPPGESVNLNVVFDATGLSDENYSAKLVVKDSLYPDLDPDVEVPVSLSVTGVPYIVVEPLKLDFGQVIVGETATKSLTVKNNGGDVLEVTEMESSDGSYTVDRTQFSVPPLKSQTVEVNFAPKSAGTIPAALTITSNDPAHPEVTVELTGEGVTPPTISVEPASLDEMLCKGDTSTQTLTIGNIGSRGDLVFCVVAVPASAPAANPAQSNQPPQRQAGSAIWKDSGLGAGIKASPPPTPNEMVALVDIIEDATGDALNPPDIVKLRGKVTADKLILQIVVNDSLNPRNFGGSTGLDIDGDASTGVPLPFGNPEQKVGVEYTLEYFSLADGVVKVINQLSHSFVGSYSALIEDDRVAVAIPLSDLDGDDGRMNIAGVLGDSSAATDWIPDAGCGTLGVAWLSLAPVEGFVPPGSNTPLTVTFDTTNLTVGNNFATILIGSNDKDKPTVEVSVSLTVDEEILGDVSGNGVVSAHDAALVLQAVVGTLELSSYQRSVADVTGDGTISAFDAALILQFTVELIAEFPAQQTPPVAPHLNASRSYALRIEPAQVKTERMITIPIIVSEMDGLLSGEIVLSYDSNLLRPVQVSTTKRTGQRMLSYQADGGQLRIALASARSTSGEGKLANVTFEILQRPIEGSTQLNLSSALLNEGLPVNTADGVIRWIPGNTALLPNYPNPFNPETWLPYQLARDSEVTIAIYDGKGRLVRLINLGAMPAGMYFTKGRAIYWDGRNDQSERVASGLYFYQLKAGDFSATRKMVIVK